MKNDQMADMIRNLENLRGAESKSGPQGVMLLYVSNYILFLRRREFRGREHIGIIRVKFHNWRKLWWWWSGGQGDFFFLMIDAVVLCLDRSCVDSNLCMLPNTQTWASSSKVSSRFIKIANTILKLKLGWEGSTEIQLEKKAYRKHKDAWTSQQVGMSEDLFFQLQHGWSVGLVQTQSCGQRTRIDGRSWSQVDSFDKLSSW